MNFVSQKKDIFQLIQKAKLNAITQKAIREGKSWSEIASRLISDPYFQQQEQLIGVKQTNLLIRETIKNAFEKCVKSETKFYNKV